MIKGTEDVRKWQKLFRIIIVCTLTASLILTSGIVDLETGASISGASKLGLATEAFTNSFGAIGGLFIAVAVALFAFSTVLGWSYYGTKGWEFLSGTVMAITNNYSKRKFKNEANIKPMLSFFDDIQKEHEAQL